MSRRMTPIDDRLYDYLVSHSVREPALLKQLREETEQLGNAAEMQICPEQGQLLGMLIKLSGVRQVIEVGTFTGYSSLSMAMALPADGHLLCCDVNDEWTDIAQQYWAKAGIADKITLKLAPALETLDTLLSDNKAGTIDAVFIDADKANYTNYYERALQLVRPRGMILIDNVLWDGFVADPAIQNNQTNSIRALNDLIAQDNRVDATILAVGDGMTLAIKK